ncbi:concanavalin A-like lectin/glucanase domain-containing protein [Xylariales sp. PMI_506]|nr:concanavalin A-like lectin/glucanase domain-containing protein [Xylariales sp. PMI_506]
MRLTQDTACSPDTALSSTIDIDFTQGASDAFDAFGNVAYGSNGAVLTVAKSGDAPTLTSKWYIMFGRVEITMQAAAGNGIVSSLVLESDDLDEIDCEWMGYDGGNLQTMYFDQGTGPSTRLDIVPVANNQEQFVDYVLEWTSESIVWSAGGTVLRTLAAGDASTSEFPQTPMMVKLGAWSPGDPSTNAEGTVEWAHGPTDYSQGPFNMYVKNLKVTDYSTGKQYVYGDHSGSWESIVAVDGTINGNLPSGGGVHVPAPTTTTTTTSSTTSTKSTATPTTTSSSAGRTSTTTDAPDSSSTKATSATLGSSSTAAVTSGGSGSSPTTLTTKTSSTAASQTSSTAPTKSASAGSSTLLHSGSGAWSLLSSFCITLFAAVLL